MAWGSRTKMFLAMFGVAALLAGCSVFESTTSGETLEPEASDIPTALVVDGSASMNIDDAPGPRIDAAKTAARAYIDALPDETSFSLWTYGTGTGNTDEEQEAGCRDTSNLIPSAAVDHDAARESVDGITPSGWSPIAATMQEAGSALPSDEPANLVVVTDGEDTCGEPTICQVAQELHQSHPQLRIDAVGFMVNDPELNCAATTTGGLYVTADNTEQLTRRLAVSRDTEMSKNTLTGRSFQGIEIGASHEAISEAYDDFPSLNDGEVTQCTSGDCGSNTIIVIHWMDCDWHFTEGGILQLIDPGEDARTIDGFSVGDSAAELETFYGTPVNESQGMIGSDEVKVRWYESDVDLGLAWRVVIDANDTIRTIVLCKCLPGSTPSPGESSGSSGGSSDQATSAAPVAPRTTETQASGGGAASGTADHTEIVIYDVFEDDGSVREPFKSTVVEANDPPSVACAAEPEQGSTLYECGQYQTDWTVGRCSVNGASAYCPTVNPSGQVTIEKYSFDQYYKSSTSEFSEALPAGVVDSNGTLYVRGIIFGLADYRYLDFDSAKSHPATSTGLRAPNGEFPLNNSQPVWTAEFARGYDADKDHETIPIKRVYFFE